MKKIKSIPINLTEMPPKGKAILRIDGEYYQSYYRKGNNIFIKPLKQNEMRSLSQ